MCILKLIKFINTATCNIEDAMKDEKVKVDPVSSQYVQDDEVTFFCDSEYQLTNSSKPFIMRVCKSDRTWSGTDSQCEKVRIDHFKHDCDFILM